ncbi:hypothetical protein [Variovorax sp. WS11]|uniref:hypothetical protein n=1 Tax=Variovorax sp. WS11 TaxID=1105204 RepID=UPI0013DCACA3|nr:hypothetical protein [Variovorax sp. WS11]NDZ14331.1 hypothetical protein [Variovorax sp. WS11]
MRPSRGGCRAAAADGPNLGVRRFRKNQDPSIISQKHVLTFHVFWLVLDGAQLIEDVEVRGAAQQGRLTAKRCLCNNHGLRFSKGEKQR